MTSVLNHAALEAAVSARYLEHYLHTVEELPNDIQIHVSQLRELDGKCAELFRAIEEQKSNAVQEVDASKRRKAMLTIKRKLLELQEVGDEKLALTAVINENIETYARQLDVDKEDMDPSTPKENEKEPEVKKESRVEAEKVEKPPKRQRRQKTQDGNDDDTKSSVSGAIIIPIEQEDNSKAPQQKKKKKRKTKRENSPLPFPYDPNEPKYCLCNEVSYGEMIGCDNDKCPIEWFHFNCVELTTKPKGRWYCPKCRGDKPNVKRPDK